MNRKKAAATLALILSASMTAACCSTEDIPETTSDSVGTTAETVPINTETLGFFGHIDTYTGPVVDFKMTPDRPYRTGSVLGEHGAAHLTCILGVYFISENSK